jgi:hypothetical protein
MRGICLNAHAAAAAVALLAAPQLAIHKVFVDRNAGRHTREQSHKALPVRLTGRGKTQHEVRYQLRF